MWPIEIIEYNKVLDLTTNLNELDKKWFKKLEVGQPKV